jgi:hypothetical protein
LHAPFASEFAAFLIAGIFVAELLRFLNCQGRVRIEPEFLLKIKTGQTGAGAIVFRAIFTDSHFWVPLFVLVLGILLLVFLH